jgi:dCTP deaminase
MGVLSDKHIENYYRQGELTVEPFISSQVSNDVISYGLSSCGIDLRLGRNFKVVDPGAECIIDSKKVSKHIFTSYNDKDSVVIPANGFCLAEAVEYIEMPRFLMGLVTLKSTIARCGINAPSTVVEPGWKGRLTLELANQTPLPVKLYAGEGIVQILFIELSSPCSVSYADRRGKYQDQVGLTLPKVGK